MVKISASQLNLYKVTLNNHKMKTESIVFVGSHTLKGALAIIETHHSFDGCVFVGIVKESNILIDGNYGKD